MSLVFNSKSDLVHGNHLSYYEEELPNLKLKTWPKQLFGFLLLDIAFQVANLFSTTSAYKYSMAYYREYYRGEVSLYHWPPAWLAWNQLYDN